MIDALIRLSLTHRVAVIALALFLLILGSWQASQLPIDVLPDVNRPRVVVLTEAPGLAPEEVEALVTLPLEVALNGATGVQAVRSASGIGLSVIYVEFDWGTDIYVDRQIVNERLQLAADKLPPGMRPQLAPISSIMGQILIVGMWSEGDATSPMELRTLADWTVRQRLLKIPGVAQVLVMGGQRQQFQVLVDPSQLLAYGVTLADVEAAVRESNANATGGYLDEQGSDELVVRSLGRVQTLDDLRRVVVTTRGGRPITIEQVARVVHGAAVQRGDAAAHVRTGEGFTGGPAVVLTINKQPEADTRDVTREVVAAMDELRRGIADDVRINTELFQQSQFIDRAIGNVSEALREGGILVVIVLFVFLLNFRTTLITLTAIPLSIVVTALVFRWFGLSINTMTLGGLAVAIGELVDDAIVDAENVYRRLRENRQSATPRPALAVVYDASREIRGSIVYGTVIVVVMFTPLFALSGMEGRLFEPIAVAYIVSILCSLLVSLTVTPVLASWLLPRARFMRREREGLVLRGLQSAAQGAIAFSLRHRALVLGGAAAAFVLAAIEAARLERDFLPPFNEGSAQVNVVLRPGTNLRQSNEVAEVVGDRLRQVDDVVAIVRRTGRAEDDEHAENVNRSEIIVTTDPDSPRSREEILDELRAAADVPGVQVSVEQPLAHLLSHMLSGVQAQVAIKIFGDDLDQLRRAARLASQRIADVPGVRDLFVEPQVTVPQLQIELDRDRLAFYGLTPQHVNTFIETAMQGRHVSDVLLEMRSFDLLIRLDEAYREDLEALARLTLELPDGSQIPLSSVAKIRRGGGPNTIQREGVRRRIVVQCNVSGRGLVDVVDEIRERLAPVAADLPAGYFIEYGGQFESQRRASVTMSVLFVAALVAMFLILFTLFRSASFALQVMMAVPLAFIGAVLALVVTGQTLTIAAMVGFVSLCGIAARNGILLLSHYLHLVRYEGEDWTQSMIVRAGRERVAPVLMTALTSGIGLVPLALAAGEPGKELLYPVATVIIGGLTTSTLLEFIVRPAMFWTVGRSAGRRVIEHREQSELLWSTAADTAHTGRLNPIE